MKPETNEMRDVSILYQQLVGKPTVPPYWALGFHLARWSYANLQEVKDLQVSMENAKMPLEGQWLDIDYMDSKRDFTTDSQKWPKEELLAWSRDMRAKHKKVIIILDPCINNVDPEYQPFQRAQTEGVSWIMNGTEPFQARVWPGECFFPDFADQTTRNWWVSEMNSFYENFSEFDGLWIDMNDPSNFKTSRGTAIKPLIEIRDWDVCTDDISNPPIDFQPYIATGKL